MKKRNPELDHEYYQGKFDKKPKPIIYRDADHVIEPYEMKVMSDEAGGFKTSGWKQKLLAAIAVIAAIALGAFLLYGVIPWLIQTFNPDGTTPIGYGPYIRW